MSVRGTEEKIAIAALKRHPRNARKHPKKQIRQLAASIRRFGFIAPIIIDEDNVVLAGHGRMAAAIEAGLDSLPCVRLTGLSDEEKRAYLLADNKLALNATWDVELVAAELSEFVVADFDIEILGFDKPEVDALLMAANDASVQPSGPDDDPPDPPPLADAVSQPGDRWILGKHILINGDAKDIAVFELLMGNELADMTFTDPPYNVPMQGHASGLGRVTHREFVEASGEMSRQEFTGFLHVTCSNIAHVSKNGAIIFTCMDWRHLTEITAAGEAAFDALKNICVWVKSNAGMGTFYRSHHEHVLVWKVGDAPHTNTFGLGDKGRHRTNVWNYAGVTSFRAGRGEELAMHPTVKPVALVADAIRDVSHRGEIVLDPFGGSGTTLIAAEKTGRRARLLELDPVYCDVIIRRWQKLTGKDAMLDGTDETFEMVELRRKAAALNVGWGSAAA